MNNDEVTGTPKKLQSIDTETAPTVSLHSQSVDRMQRLTFLSHTSTSKTSLEKIPQEVQDVIIPMINSGYGLRKVAEHLNVSSKSISAFAKMKGYVWSIAKRSYVLKSEYESSKISMEKKKATAFSGDKSLNSGLKKVTVALSKTSFNILEMHKCLQNKSADIIMDELIIKSSTPEQRALAQSLDIIVRSRKVEENLDLHGENNLIH